MTGCDASAARKDMCRQGQERECQTGRKAGCSVPGELGVKEWSCETEVGKCVLWAGHFMKLLHSLGSEFSCCEEVQSNTVNYLLVRVQTDPVSASALEANGSLVFFYRDALPSSTQLEQLTTSSTV